MNDRIQTLISNFTKEAGKRLVGQEQLLLDIFIAFIADGHVLLEGVPGLAKTLTIKTAAEILGMDFKRIQFTPDLLPADITGTLIYEQNKGSFSVRKGPIFSNIILADEINRAPAKVQSAMLEAMEERHVTIGDSTFTLPNPFFVLATQNPIEQEGTYNLPEAELDRFLMKLLITYPSCEDEIKIIQTCGDASKISVQKLFSKDDFDFIRETYSNINCDDAIAKYVVSIMNVTRANSERKNDLQSHDIHSVSFGNNSKNDITRYIQFGASPRAGIAMLKCAKGHALIQGRDFVLPEDVKAVACNVLRHRIVLSYEALADNVTTDDIINRILEFIPIP